MTKNKGVMGSRSKSKVSADERGMVAIVVTVFFMIVLTLIVLAFSQAARREQRQTLDNQLAKQAFYAAESGINDVAKQIDDGTIALTQKSTCDPVPTPISQDGVIAYSCVLFEREPTSLVYDSINQKGQLVSLQTSVAEPDEVTFNWSASAGGSTFSGCTASTAVNELPAKSSYEVPPAHCDAGVLRIFLMAVRNGGSFSRDDLVNNSFTVFLRPTNDSTVTDVNYATYASGANTQGAIFGAKCVDNGQCTSTIKNIPSGYTYYVFMRSIYKDNKVDIAGKKAGVPVNFNKAQTKIDSTGRANDVLRRLQVRIPTTPSTAIEGFAIEAMDGICKQLDVYPGYANYDQCSGLL